MWDSAHLPGVFPLESSPLVVIYFLPHLILVVIEGLEASRSPYPLQSGVNFKFISSGTGPRMVPTIL